jgi:hypothetical protein
MATYETFLPHSMSHNDEKKISHKSQIKRKPRAGDEERERRKNVILNI